MNYDRQYGTQVGGGGFGAVAALLFLGVLGAMAYGGYRLYRAFVPAETKAEDNRRAVAERDNIGARMAVIEPVT